MIYTLYLILGVLSFVPSICYAIYLVQYYKDLKSREIPEALNNQLEEFHFLELTNLEKKHFGRIIHNRRGNGLVGAMIATVIIGIAMMGLCQLMGVMNFSQLTIQRKAVWVTTKATINTLLSNAEACRLTVTQLNAISSTVTQPVLVSNAAGNAVFQPNTLLGHGVIVQSINLIGIGIATAPLGTVVTLNQNGNSSNYHLTSAIAGQYIQQALLTIVVEYGNQTALQNYYLNVVLDNAGHPIGCSL